MQETIKKEPYRYYSKKKCVICGSMFEPRTSTHLTCSDGCALVRKRQGKNRFMKKYVEKNKKNPNFLFKRFLNASIRRCIINKTMPTATYITYTKEQFIEHISSKFQEGMSWENYGKDGWHIDHIKPLFLFDFIDKNGQVNMDELIKANSLENLQPLWAKENLSKNCRYEVGCED